MKTRVVAGGLVVGMCAAGLLSGCVSGRRFSVEAERSYARPGMANGQTFALRDANAASDSDPELYAALANEISRGLESHGYALATGAAVPTIIVDVRYGSKPGMDWIGAVESQVRVTPGTVVTGDLTSVSPDGQVITTPTTYTQPDSVSYRSTTSSFNVAVALRYVEIVAHEYRAPGDFASPPLVWRVQVSTTVRELEVEEWFPRMARVAGEEIGTRGKKRVLIRHHAAPP